ncbi:MAG: GntR family transcriptional regulator [Clostridiaceae bacterium]|nr:GntR family transcriptional regulator [Clostridiaceae bacterium]
MPLDKHSSVPLYAQLKEVLLARIESGEYQPGERIPTEMQLCEEMQLSRPTVRQAVSELVNEGLLEIYKGRGTFVREETKRCQIAPFSGFTFGILSANTLEGMNFVDYREVDKLPGKIAAAFVRNRVGGSPGYSELIWRGEHNRQVVAYCKSWIPKAMFPDLLKDVRLRRPMIDITANKYAFLPQKVETELMVRPAMQNEARIFDIPRGESVIVVTSVFLSRSGDVCEVVNVVLSAKHCSLRLDSSVR